MPDLKLKTVKIRNWMRMQSVHLAFPEKGLVVVTGTNKASNGRMASVGSGKTALGEALSYTLFGNAGRFTNAKECSREPGGDTYVRVEAELRGKLLVVESGYKCKELSTTGEGLRYTYEGKQYERGRIEQTRADLSALLDVSPLMAQWTVFLDGDAIKFGKLPQAERIKLVLECLKQPPWGLYHERAKGAALELRKALARDSGTAQAAEAAIVSAQSALNVATDTLTAVRRNSAGREKRLRGEVDAKRTLHAKNADQIAAGDARRKVIKREIDKLIEAHAGKQKQAEIEINEARDAKRVLETARRAKETALRAAEAAAAVPQQKLATLLNTPKACPTCNQSWPKKPNKAEIMVAQDAVDAADRAVAKAKAALDTAEAKIEQAETTIVERQNALTAIGGRQKITELSNEDQGLERTVRRLLNENANIANEVADLEADLQEALGAVAVEEAKVNERQQTLAAAEVTALAARAAEIESKQALSAVAYWCEAFAPAGIPNKVLRDAVEPLNHEAERVSMALTGGTIRVQFSTSRRKADGDLKPELAVTVTNSIGGSRLELNSKGENGLANLIVAETLGVVGQVSARVGFRWYDEVLPNQDQKVVQSVYARLGDLADSAGILIFLVDHSATAANYATHTLNVTKAGKPAVSTVTWI